ncbi:nuclease HARBI1-like protein [Aphelenchoides avenae]|nr:nuclease HARBI1-like protein [Aphelenchus avenae]
MEQRVYNYRISRARRVIENVFGIMAAKWRILLRPIEAEPETTARVVLAICALHNYVIDESAGEAPATMADTGLGNDAKGCWRQQGAPLMPLANRATGNRPTQAAVNMRRLLVDFFNGPGAVEWQDEYA